MLASLTTTVWNVPSKSWTGDASMAASSLNRRMTVRLGDAVAFAEIGAVGLDGQIELEALRPSGLPEKAPRLAAHLSHRLRAEGVPMFDFRTTTQNLSPAIMELDAAMRSGRLRHDANPVLAWCIGNVVGQEDRRGNLFPAKVRDAKIDAAIALLMAIGRAQASESDGAQDITAFLLNPVMG